MNIQGRMKVPPNGERFHGQDRLLDFPDPLGVRRAHGCAPARVRISHPRRGRAVHPVRSSDRHDRFRHQSSERNTEGIRAGRSAYRHRFLRLPLAGPLLMSVIQSSGFKMIVPLSLGPRPT